MGAGMGNPATSSLSDAVRKAVVDCYSELEHVDVAVVEAGFDGGVPFDSILGVEMAAQLEITLAVLIPEESLMRTSVYKSLSSFARVVQACVDAGQESNR